MHMDQSINSVILLIGLAVGVDYSLFYLRREREERAAGRSPADALQVAAATSGRAVLVSGLTVMTAMAGMFLMGTRIFQGFGVGTVLVVAIALVGSLTVLPAVLSKLGDRVDRGRIPFLQPRRRATASRASGRRSSARCCAGRCCGAALAALLLIALAIPAFRLHTADSGVQGLPRDLPVMQVYARVQKAFPGGPLPGGRRRQRARRDRPAGDGRRSPRSSARRSPAARCSRADQRRRQRLPAAPRASRSRSPGTGTDTHVQPRARRCCATA